MLDTSSLPVGNGRLTAQVWVDAAAPSIVSLYATVDGMLTDQHWLQKAGRIDVDVGVSCADVVWWLDAYTGTAHLTCGGGSSSAGGVDIAVAVSHTDDTIYMAGDLGAPGMVRVSANLWRVNRTIPNSNNEWRNAYGLCEATDVNERADALVPPAGDNRIVWFQRNEPSNTVWLTSA